MSTADQPVPAPSAPPPTAPRRRRHRWLDAFYPAIWRWHFWAGLLVAPVLVVVSLTGALFVFHEEINELIQPGLRRVAPGGARLPCEARLAAARAHLGDGWRLAFISESDDPARADELLFEKEKHHDPAAQSGENGDGHDHEYMTVMVNPHTANVTGSASSKTGFTGVVLRLHRTLLAGAPGRIIVELATCWGIVTLLTGLLLWWPRLKGKIRGVWLPRFRRGGGTALRDLHVVPAIYTLPLALIIMFTGLLFTPVWGRGFFAGLYLAGQLPAGYISPPKSAPAPEGARLLTADEAIAAARRHFDFGRISVRVPARPGDAWLIASPLDELFKPGAFVSIDACSGAALDVVQFRDLPLGARLARWFYPVHTGAIFGLPTKILAVAACLAIILMSVTGVMMWWRRRPPGKSGAPRKPPGSPPAATPASESVPEAVPKAIVCVIVFLGVVFPLVGASLLLLLAGQLIVRRVRRKSTR
ncbi:MAG: PepSY domain-containing protein [Opitutaceae bacterium]|nr:PepSY domain-containing protein [Opitutaceae bacterium]